MKRTGPTNPQLKDLIANMRGLARKQNVNLWKRLAEELEKPSRQRRVVNISTINRNTKDNETIVVPGKVLSVGDLDHKVVIAAFSFSKEAKEKISSNKSQVMGLDELMKKNPQGKGVRIIG